MGVFVALPGRLDASRLSELFRGLHAALSGPGRLPDQLVVRPIDGSGSQRVLEHLQAVLGAVAGRDRKAMLAAGFSDHQDAGRVDRLRGLVRDLESSWRVRLAEKLTGRKRVALRDLLQKPFPDYLTLLGRQDDENAHSDVLRWLLDPRCAPTVAPATLSALIKLTELDDDYASRLRAAIARDGVSVRREVLMGREAVDVTASDRVDLVVSGPDFVLAIENKVWSYEHDEQTRTYWGWLDSLPRDIRRAGIFLTPSGLPASCSSFRPVSYLELLACLLEAPASGSLGQEEEAVLVGYLKALRGSILRQQLRTLEEEARP